MIKPTVIKPTVNKFKEDNEKINGNNKDNSSKTTV